MIDENSLIEFDAIQQLAQQHTKQSLGLLCEYIEGKLSDRLPSLYHYRQGAAVLVDRGEPGRDHLCHVLKLFCKSPRKAKWAKIIADTLKSKDDIDAVRKSLRIWRCSPARVTLVLRNWVRRLLGRS